jgi:hypothetical protein
MPEPARAAARFGVGAEPDDRVGTLRGRPQQPSCHRVEARQRGSQSGGVRPPRVHRVDHDPGARELLCPDLGKDDLCALGSRVHLCPFELPALALQVINPELLRVHAARGHVDDPRRGAFLEQWDQQVRQQERADDVGRERELDPVGRNVARFGHHPGVVDQHIQARSLTSKASGELPDRLELAEIADPHVHVAVTGPLDDPHARLLAALRAANDQPDRRAETRKALSGGQTKPRARARDQHYLALHPPQLRRAPPATADPIADVREAGNDGAVEDIVEQRVDHALSERSRRWLWSEPVRYVREALRDRGLVSSSWTSQIRRSANPASQ